MGTFKIGTLIQDQGKIGIIRGIVEPNSKSTGHRLVDMRKNYEIYYFDGVVGHLGCRSMLRLISAGYIKILYNPNAGNKLIDVLDN